MNKSKGTNDCWEVHELGATILTLLSNVVVFFCPLWDFENGMKWTVTCRFLFHTSRCTISINIFLSHDSFGDEIIWDTYVKNYIIGWYSERLLQIEVETTKSTRKLNDFLFSRAHFKKSIFSCSSVDKFEECSCHSHKPHQNVLALG